MKNISKILIIASLMIAPISSFAAPSVLTKSVSNITDTGATLNGYGSPDPSLPTTAYFRYSEMQPAPVFCNDLYGNNMVSTDDIKLNSASSFSQDINGLTPDTTYFYCAIASTKSSIIYGSNAVYSFTTLPCPNCSPTSITTKPATDMTKTSATLNGFYNTRNPVTVWFEYSKNYAVLSGGGGIKVGKQSFGQNSSGSIYFNLSGLTTNALYRYRAAAQKSDGTKIYGDIKAFTAKGSGGASPCPATLPPNPSGVASTSSTSALSSSSPYSPSSSIGLGIPALSGQISNPVVVSGNPNNNPPGADPCAPIISTYPASGVSQNAATLNGSWDANGLPTSTWFEWGPSLNMAYSSAHIAQSGSSGLMSFNAGGLTAGTTYYFRAVGKNAKGAAQGSTLTFMTGGIAPLGGGGTTPPGGGTTTPPGTPATPPNLAIVHYHEGVETVFVRQIMNNPALANLWGYKSGQDLAAFANYEADQLARIFGYVGENGKEVRVVPPDVAAYELTISPDNIIGVKEYFGGYLISTRTINPTLKMPINGYEYYYQK
jgi:hypothetical protein